MEMVRKLVLLISFSLLISYAYCDGVRAGPPVSRTQNAVRSGTGVQSSQPGPVASTSQNVASGSAATPAVQNKPDDAGAAGAATDGQPAVNSAAVSPSAAGGNPNTFSGIRDEFVGGVGAIRDSAGHLIGLTVGTVAAGVSNAVHNVKEGVVGAVNAVEEGVANAVRPVVDFGGRVVNKTVQVTSNVANAGHQIAGVWGQGIRETANITGQLIGRRRR